MKKIFNISVLLSACLLLAGISACSNDELNTDQYPDKSTKLASYGPNPVMRGATLRFFGSNLQNVKEVQVPGIDAITDIEVVTSGSPSEIRVQLPNDGEEIGNVVLITSDGKQFTTQTALSYTEPIVFTSFSPDSAMPGDVITITGDYMNLVQSVTFEGGATVSEVKHIDRYKATVTVPSKAITGKIILSDEGEIANLLYSEKELSIGDPKVTKLTVGTAKPAEKLTITGSYLDMIKEIVFAGDVVVTDFTLSEDHKTITLDIPATAQSGDVTAVSYAAKDFTAGKITMIKPDKLAVSPKPVKAGEELTISGSNLDIVTTVDLPGASGVEFTYKSSKITLTVPATATEGDVKLSMANGDAVTAAYTLVHPVVTAVSPTTLTAGGSITVTGTNLDLVTGVTLGGKTEEFKATKTTVTVSTSATSVSGKLVLTLANGEKVTPGEAITIEYESFIVVNSMPSAEHIGATVTLKGSNFMMIENIYIGEAKVAQYISRSDKEISFIMPYNSVGTYSMKFHLLSGDVEVCPTQIEVLLEIKHIIGWEGKLTITWNDGGRVLVPASKFDGIKAGTKMRVYYTQKDQSWDQAAFVYGDFSGINFDGDGGIKFNKTLVPTDVHGWFPDGILDRCDEVVLTQTILDNIQALKKECEGQANIGLIIHGTNLTFTKVEILQEIPQEKTIWEGSENLVNYDRNLELGGTSKAWVNAGLAVGDDIRIYFTATDAAEWQVQVFNGNWASMSFAECKDTPSQFNAANSPTAAKDGYVSFKVTSDIYNTLTNVSDWGYAIILQGKAVTFTKITIK